MNDDAFEKLLRRQPLRRVPSEWRAEILRAANGQFGPAAAANPRRLKPKMPWLTAWLWPHPAAWAGLGVAWLIIFTTTTATQPRPDAGAGLSMAQSRPPMNLLEQRRLLTQVLGPSPVPSSPAVAPRGQKRSERQLTYKAA